MYLPGARLLFVHIPKTGGESVATVISAQGWLGAKHATYREFRLSCPRYDHERPMVVCFVRNPWDQVVSFYSHLRKPAYLPKEAISPHPEYFADGYHLHPLEVSKSACNEEFPAWVRRWYASRRHHPRLARLEHLPRLLDLVRGDPGRGADGVYSHYRDDADKYLLPYLEWIRTPGGQLRADFIGRFENLRQDFGRLADRLGVKAELPHVNASQRGDYRGFYDDLTRRLIADYYAPEIKQFNYEF
jgi:hypothetical protein